MFETPPRTLAAEGLPYDRCQIGVVTSLEPDYTLEDLEVLNSDQLYRVMRTQVDVVLKRGVAVLNADDPLVADMASLADGEVMFYSLGEPEVLTAHLARNGRAVIVRAGLIELATGTQREVLMAVDRLSPLAEPLESVLATVAGAWALGLAPELIRAGLEAYGQH